MLKQNRLNQNAYNQVIASYYGHLKHGNSYYLFHNQIKKYQNYSPTIVGEFVRISKTGNIYKIEQY